MTNWTPRAANQLASPPAPEIDRVRLATDGTLTLQAAALADRAYRVDLKDSLVAPAWVPLATNRTVNGTVTFIDHIGGQGQRFYRVVLLP